MYIVRGWERSLRSKVLHYKYILYMSSLITIRLYNDDWTPRVWDTPLLSAIQESSGAKVLTDVAMTEVSDWFYKYDFTNYKNTELYFFFIDWEEYDWINQLDAYGNKWSRWAGWMFLNTEQIAKDIRAIKEWDVKKWTIGRHVFDLQNISLENIINKINLLFGNITTKSDEMVLQLSNVINWIKIPKQINVIDIVKPIEDILNNNTKAYADSINNSLETLKNTLVDLVSSDEKYDDSEMKEMAKEMIEWLEELEEKVESIWRLEMKIDEKEDSIWSINELVSWIKEEMIETNRKMNIVFSRLNKQ